MTLETWFVLTDAWGLLESSWLKPVALWSLAEVCHGGKSLRKEHQVRGGRNVTQEVAKTQARYRFQCTSAEDTSGVAAIPANSLCHFFSDQGPSDIARHGQYMW